MLKMAITLIAILITAAPFSQPSQPALGINDVPATVQPAHWCDLLPFWPGCRH